MYTGCDTNNKGKNLMGKCLLFLFKFSVFLSNIIYFKELKASLKRKENKRIFLRIAAINNAFTL